MIEIQEQINVWVFFRKNRIEPFLFSWQGRKIKIDKINLIHTSKDGSSLFSTENSSADDNRGLFYHFSLSAGNNFYRLKFDSKSLQWFLEYLEES